MVLQTMAVPVLSFDTWAMYIPSWQEVATTILPLAYGVILIMISYRYLPIFPQERELNPIVSDDVETAAVAGEASADEKLQPAEA
jgi:Ni/Fe-hydrogenase subunit HybB-like protein